MLLLVNVSVNNNVVNGTIRQGLIRRKKKRKAICPVNRLVRLTELVGNLSAQIEAGMARLDSSAGDGSPQIRRRLPEDPD